MVLRNGLTQAHTYIISLPCRLARQANHVRGLNSHVFLYQNDIRRPVQLSMDRLRSTELESDENSTLNQRHRPATQVALVSVARRCTVRRYRYIKKCHVCLLMRPHKKRKRRRLLCFPSSAEKAFFTSKRLSAKGNYAYLPSCG